MSLKVYYNEASMKHKLYPLFSEKSTRITGLLELFIKRDLAIIISREATVDEVEEAHSRKYIDHVKDLSKQSLFKAFLNNTLSSYVQWYIRVSKGSYAAALYSAGGVCQAVEEVLSSKATKAFCITRPPGHHAGIEKGEGFCIFNNIAIGALHAIKKGAKKVAIIDFDRHHGNGTAEIVEKSNKDILFISSFQDGCKYFNNKKSTNDNIVSLSIAEHSPFSVVEEMYKNEVIPKLYEFKPDIILLSSGFDMHLDDPLTNIKLESKDFYTLTKMIITVADEICNGRVVSALEGGYDVQALQECVGYHVDAF